MILFPTAFLVCLSNVVIAEVTIIIKSDGSIIPENAPIARSGSFYVFLADMQSSIIVERSNITIDGNGFVIEGKGEFQSKGIILNGVFNVTIRNVGIKRFYYGVWLYNAQCNRIVDNILSMNTGRAIWLGCSNNNTIATNKLIENKGRGLMLENSSNNVIENNSIIENGCDPIILSHSNGNWINKNLIAKNNGRGIWLGHSNNNVLVENNITENCYSGIQLYHSNSNIFFGNTIYKNNIYGIQLLNSSQNHIYNNNFINNTLPVQVDASINSWDNGLLDGGNYWSHINADDSYSGLMQNENGSDGIVDEPYIINENNVDHYPLAGTYSSFKIIFASCSISIVSTVKVKSLTINVNGTVILHISKVNFEQQSIFRLVIPHKLLSPPYMVEVDNEPIKYFIIFENESLSILYFHCYSPSEILLVPDILHQFLEDFLIISTFTVLVIKILPGKKIEGNLARR
jgi:parallel beta-helix repeat protein